MSICVRWNMLILMDVLPFRLDSEHTVIINNDCHIYTSTTKSNNAIDVICIYEKIQKIAV